jgi:peptidoglycan/LPS O-acetylase OafA/YrhL
LRFSPLEKGGPVAHDPRLDGLRGFAAVSVMLVHGSLFYEGPYAPRMIRPNEFLLNLHMSRAAVFLFFITSGYVIGLTNQRPFSWPLAREYLRRRCLRLVPIYLLAIAAGWLAYRNVSRWNVLENAFFLQNPAWHIPPLAGNLPVWSLHNEVVCYLGFLFLWAFRPRVVPVVLVLVALSAGDWFFGGPLSFLGGWSVGGLFWITGLMLSWQRTVRTAPIGIPILSLVLLTYATNHLWPGVVLLRGMGFPYAGESTIWLADLILIPVTTVLFCSVVNLDFPGRRWVGSIAILIPAATCLMLQMMGRLWASAPWTLAGIATIAAFPLMALKQDHWGTGFFRLFRPLGRISYGLYLFHAPCIVAVNALYPWTGGPYDFVGALLSWLAMTVFAAWICEARLQPALLSFYKNYMARSRREIAAN